MYTNWLGVKNPIVVGHYGVMFGGIFIHCPTKQNRGCSASASWQYIGVQFR